LSQVERRIETAKVQAVRQRNYRRARDRALARLANDYPNVYRTYLEEEREADEQMGKKWLDINGNTRATRNLRAEGWSASSNKSRHRKKN
jgi:hypothetical protein